MSLRTVSSSDGSVERKLSQVGSSIMGPKVWHGARIHDLPGLQRQFVIKNESCKNERYIVHSK